MNRRDLYRLGTVVLGGLAAAALAVPGVAYLLTPLRKTRTGDAAKSAEAAAVVEGVPLTRLSELKPGVPRLFPVIEKRQDSWVKYPPEPIGSVWLIREAEDNESGSPRVRALSAECPHLSCAVNLSLDQKSFLCPCHDSKFQLDGGRVKEPGKVVPSARDLDTLEVSLSTDSDPEVRVKFLHFRPMLEEKIPIG